MKKKGFLQQNIRIGRKYYFDSIESIYLILDSGQDILTAVTATREDAEDRRLKEVLEEVSSDLKRGSKFWETLSQREVIPARFIQILKVGEENGILNQTLKIVLEQYNHEKDLKGKVNSASIYPAIVLSLTLVIGLGISWFILPQLTTLYANFDGELPLATRILSSYGIFVRTNGYWFFPALISFIFLIITLYKVFPMFRRLGEKIMLATPGVRNLLLESEMSRMGFILGNLLTVGITFDKALESIIDATPLLVYRDLYKNYYDSVLKGSSFSAFFKDGKVSKRIMPASVRHLIVAAEKSGSMPKIFLDLGMGYKRRMEKTSENLTKLLEPILLIVMFLFVALLAIGIIGPIYGSLGSLSSF